MSNPRSVPKKHHKLLPLGASVAGGGDDPPPGVFNIKGIPTTRKQSPEGMHGSAGRVHAAKREHANSLRRLPTTRRPKLTCVNREKSASFNGPARPMTNEETERERERCTNTQIVRQVMEHYDSISVHTNLTSVSHCDLWVTASYRGTTSAHSASLAAVRSATVPRRGPLHVS